MKKIYKYSMFLLTVLSVTVSNAAGGLVPVKFKMDWVVDGTMAPFALPVDEGYYKTAGLDVTLVAGEGSDAAIKGVAEGKYQMAMADMSALMGYYGQNADAPNKPVAVMAFYTATPVVVVALKKSGINSPKDLSGKKIGAPSFDTGRKLFPLLAEKNQITDVTWVDTSVPMRETMLARGEVDAITGYASSVIVGLERRGIRRKNLVIMPYAEHGIDWYSNVIIANAEFMNKHPEAVRKFLQGLIKGIRETIPDTRGAVAKYVKPRDIDISVKMQEHVLLIDFESMFSDENKTSFGAIDMGRLNKMSKEVSRAFKLEQAIDNNQLWNGSFLPLDRTIDYKQ